MFQPNVTGNLCQWSNSTWNSTAEVYRWKVTGNVVPPLRVLFYFPLVYLGIFLVVGLVKCIPSLFKSPEDKYAQPRNSTTFIAEKEEARKLAKDMKQEDMLQP